MGGNSGFSEDPVSFMRASFNKKESGVASRLLEACSVADVVLVVSLDSFASKIFGAVQQVDELYSACKGLLIARSLCDQPGSQSEELPVVPAALVDQKYRGVVGMTLPGCQCDPRDAGRPVGKLFGNTRILCTGIIRKTSGAGIVVLRHSAGPCLSVAAA